MEAAEAGTGEPTELGRPCVSLLSPKQNTEIVTVVSVSVGLLV